MKMSNPGQKKSPGVPGPASGTLPIAKALKAGKAAQPRSNFFNGKGNKGTGGTDSK